MPKILSYVKECYWIAMVFTLLLHLTSLPQLAFYFAKVKVITEVVILYFVVFVTIK